MNSKPQYTVQWNTETELGEVVGTYAEQDEAIKTAQEYKANHPDCNVYVTDSAVDDAVIWEE